MFSKLIFVLVTMCVVNASVLTVQVYDDDPEIEVASNPKDCNFRACDQLCRRLKFPGGTCVNGRCKCDNFLNAKDVLEAEVAANPKRCNLKVCDLVCRWLNKTNGSCVDGRCKCANSLTAEDEAEVTMSSKKCTFRTCYSQCRSGNYSSGACVNGRCKCSNSTNAKDEVTEKSLYNLEETVLQQDDPETEVENKKSDCNNQACVQLCRRLKFPGGACVNGRCKCDNFLNAEVFVESLSNLEDSVSPRACNNQMCYNLCRKIKLRGGACIEGKCICNKNLSEQEDANSDPAEFLSPGSCDFRACDQQCFRYGYSGGTCVNGRCKCNRFLNTEDTLVDPVELLPLSTCNSIACDDQCRRTGWHSGVCINGQCKCDYFLNAEVSENSLSNLEDSVSPRKCTHQECNALCRKLKFREGVCIAGRCSCNNYFPSPRDTMNDLEGSFSIDDNFLSTEDEASDESLPVSELSEEQTARGCSMQACNQLCRRLKFPGGACVNGRCKCDNFFGTEVVADEYSEFAPRRICKLTKCNRKCIRRGYEGATCVNGRCKCYNNLQEKDDISETSLPVSDLSEDQTERGCNMQACDQSCRRLKFRGGTCVNGRCKCDNFFGTEDAVDEYSEIATRRVCKIRQCNQTCTRRGYESAKCINGWCNCRNKIQRQDASQLNDATSDENEESTVVLRTNEEELVVPSPSACNTVNCNQMCHRLNYAGGWCHFGQCQCY